MFSLIPIQANQVYRVKFNGQTSKILTLYRASMWLAWKLIEQEYEYPEQIQEIGTLTCACENDFDGAGQPTDYVYPNRCPLHDRNTGFFRKLRVYVGAQIRDYWNDPEHAPSPSVSICAKEIIRSES